MKDSAVKEMSPEERLVWFVKERDLIRTRREMGYAKPWTESEILQSYRFCNVVRKDDKVTRWLLKNFYVPNNKLPPITQVVFARHINKIETLRKISIHKEWNPTYLKQTLRGIEKPFGAAYVISGAMAQTGKYKDKIAIVVDGITKPMYENPPELDRTSIKSCVNSFSQRPGIGSFMAGQIVADLRWHEDFNTDAWTDNLVWAAMGPGSSRGMCRLLNLEVKKNAFKQEQFVKNLYEIRKLYFKQLPAHLYMRLEAIDVQNTLCEYDKYCRALEGEGRPKQKYNGRGQS